MSDSGLDKGDSSRPPRVLIWCPRGVDTKCYGGPATYTHRLLTSLGTRVRTNLVHANPDQTEQGIFEKQYYIPGIDTPILKMLPFLTRAKSWLRTHHAEYDVFLGIEAFHPTVVPAVYAEKLALPTILRPAAYRSDLSDKGGIKSILGLPRRRRALAQRCSAIVAISSAIRREMLEYGIDARKVATIPNGVDTEQFRPAANDNERKELRRRHGWRDLPTVIFVGAVCRRKQPHLLIDALGVLRQRGVDCQLVIVGPEQEPDYSSEMRKSAIRAGVADRVIWHGFTTQVDVLYRAADLFALLSKSEGMPNALLESKASGIPAVVTCISGSADVVRDGVDGLFVSSRPNEVAEAINNYLSRPEVLREHGRKARDVVTDTLSLARVANAYEHLFRTVMSGGCPSEVSLS